MEQITSTQNPRVKQVRKLRNRRERVQTGLFVVDNPRDLARALERDYTIAHAFYCADHDNYSETLSLLNGSLTYTVNTDLMAKISYRESPGPVVAVMHQKPRKSAAELHEIACTLVLGLVDLRKPGNIGALMRTADATGFEAILLIDTALDLYNPNIIRSSTGACFLNNVYTVTTNEALTFFQQREYAITAAVVDGNHTLYEVDFTAGPVAVVMGTEDLGLPAHWIEVCDTRVRIPMVGQIADSLNVSVSGAIFMAEALRQRF